MEITTWFGRVDTETGAVVSFCDVEAMISALWDAGTPSPAGAKAANLRELAMKSGVFEDDAEYSLTLREVCIGLVNRRFESLAGAESEVLQMIEALDDLNEAHNLLGERLYEWALLRGRASRGSDLAEDLAEEVGIGDLAGAVLELRARRRSLEGQVEVSVKAYAPNLSELAGPILAARLISRAGGLRRLSEMPSSTIQLMGAEKSLFKHLKGKAPSPKHGLIYRHPAVISSPKWLRGKVSRALAGKLAIASRIDYHTGVLYPELKVSLDGRVAGIRRRGRKRAGGAARPASRSGGRGSRRSG